MRLPANRRGHRELFRLIRVGEQLRKLLRSFLRPEPARRGQAYQRGGSNDWALVGERAAKVFVVLRARRSRPQGGSANLRIRMPLQAIEDRNVVFPSCLGEVLQRSKDDFSGWMKEDQRGNEVGASIRDQKLERGQYFSVVAAVERLEQRLERAQIEVRHFGEDGQSSPPENLSKQLQISALQTDHQPTPVDCDHRQRRSQDPRRRSRRSQRQDGDRRQRLPQSLADDIDQWLDALPDRIVHRKEQELAACSLHGVAQSRIGDLQRYR